MSKRLQSIEKAVLDRVHGHGRGWVFSPRHFLDLAPRPAIALKWVGLRAGTYFVDQAMKNKGKTSVELVWTSAVDLLQMARVATDSK